MKIFGLTVHRFHFRRRHQRKITSKLDSLVNATLLDAAVKNRKVLAQLLNKYGKIQVLPEDKLATLTEDIRGKVHREAVQTILNHRRRDLVSHVDGLIDIIMDLGNVTGRHQQEARPFEDATPVGYSSTPNMARRRLNRQWSRETSSNPSVLIRGLGILAVLKGIINQQRKKQSKDSVEE